MEDHRGGNRALPPGPREDEVHFFRRRSEMAHAKAVGDQAGETKESPQQVETLFKSMAPPKMGLAAVSYDDRIAGLLRRHSDHPDGDSLCGGVFVS